MTAQIDSSCDVARISSLSLVEQALSDEHVHDHTALSLVKQVIVALQKCSD